MSNGRTRPPSHATLVAIAVALLGGAAITRAQALPGAASLGPDVTVSDLTGTANYGSSGGVQAYAIGTESCNVGTTPVWWCDSNTGYCNNTQHPVISQNIYRLKDGRLEQLGMGWLKHGFLSLNTYRAYCLGNGGTQTCLAPPHGGDQLGVGCTDIYGPSLNGNRPLGMRAEVDVTRGSFPFPYTTQAFSDVTEERIRVQQTDLDPALNAGALYWGETSYTTADDALASNGLNNASIRPFTVSPGSFDLSFSGATIRETTAIEEWRVVDPSVELTHVDFNHLGSPTERFEVARKVTEPNAGTWHYEYAIFNMNSTSAAQRLAITFDGSAAISNVGFKDVDHHSGECEPQPDMTCPLISSVDWTSGFDGASDTVSWETDLYSIDPQANAIRWGTMYNFWFDADAPPTAISHAQLTLFKPGTPCRVAVSFSPAFVFSDDLETGDTCSWTTLVN